MKKYLISCLLPTKTSNFGKTKLSWQYDETSYNGLSETNGLFSIHFFTSVATFSSLSGSIFFFILNASYSCKFPGLNFHQLQYEQPQTQGVLVNTESFNTAKATIVTKVFINFIHNPGNPGRLNRIFLYLLDWSLQVISMQLQFFLSSFQSLHLVMNHKVNYGLIKFKV